MFLNHFLTAFIPLFFAFDAVGILPVYLSMTQDVFVDKKRAIVNQATLTVFILGFIFIYFGKYIFLFLGITVPDFKIAGGVLLLVISIYDMITTRENRRRGDLVITADSNVGIVPIGMPLIIGPAVLTTLLLSVGQNGYTATVAALVANAAIVWITFDNSDKIVKIIRRSGSIALGKIFSLLLAAIAVKMIRLGVIDLWNQLK